MKNSLNIITIFAAAILLLCPAKLKSQPNTLYFMKDIPQTKDLNPARPGIESGFYISMPLFSKLDLSANTNNWSYSDLIHWGTGTRADSLVLDLNKFLSATDKSNFIMESASLTLLEGGFKKGKNFFALSLTERELAEVFFHKNFVRLINYGNYPYLGTVYNSETFGIGAQHYREIAFNYSRDISKKLTIGGAAKILFGMGAVQTNGMSVKVASPPTGEYLDVITSGRANISAPVSFSYDNRGYINSVANNFDAGKYFNNYGNPGFAVDLGFAYHVSKKFEFSMSLIDLGAISWKTNTYGLTENKRFLYRGIQVADPSFATLPFIQPLINQLGDSIRDAFRPDSSHTGFSTLLPVKLYIGGDYKLNDNVSLSGLARVRVYNNLVHTSFTASTNVFLLNGISLTGSYSIMESTFDNLGVGAGFRTGPFQLYAASDNIFSPFYPSKARNMNLRVGINFIFNDREKESKGTGRRKGPDSNCYCPY
jgi:hypothetical protein